MTEEKTIELICPKCGSKDIEKITRQTTVREQITANVVIDSNGDIYTESTLGNIFGWENDIYNVVCNNCQHIIISDVLVDLEEAVEDYIVEMEKNKQNK
jgi:hypothetical protein